MPHFAFDNTFVRELPGLYVAWRPATVPAPTTLYLNVPLAEELGLDPAALGGPEVAAQLSGNVLPAGAEPIAQVYAGHQFGGFSPQLGDGRALLLGELIDRRGLRRDIALKGSGRTPYSRGGDGKAAVGPMLRELLIGEAMHGLGIATTRALAVVATGERVYREASFPGAVLTRVASSHLRVGTFQYFAARGDIESLRRLADYAIARHDPAWVGAPDRYLAFFRAVAERQARLIAQWMNVGFIHGVMNTDNMTISGETIDYGPCAFMEAFDPATVFSSIDHGGRYAYGNQPAIARWNLARLGEALLPLMIANEDEASVQRAVADATAVVDAFPAAYAEALLRGQRAKLGLHEAGAGAGAVGDAALVHDWLALLQAHSVDFTLAWRRLCDAAQGDLHPLRALFGEATAIDLWLLRWQDRCAREDASDATAGVAEAEAEAEAEAAAEAEAEAEAAAAAAASASASASAAAASASAVAVAVAVAGGAARAARMRRVNPWIIARNHRVEEVLAAASEHGDLSGLQSLLAALQRPYDEVPSAARYAERAPLHVTAAYQTFCGT